MILIDLSQTDAMMKRSQSEEFGKRKMYSRNKEGMPEEITWKKFSRKNKCSSKYMNFVEDSDESVSTDESSTSSKEGFILGSISFIISSVVNQIFGCIFMIEIQLSSSYSTRIPICMNHFIDTYPSIYYFVSLFFEIASDFTAICSSIHNRECVYSNPLSLHSKHLHDQWSSYGDNSFIITQYR